MLQRLKETFPGQLVVLAAAVAFSLAAELALHINLPFRPSVNAGLLGLVWALPASALCLVAGAIVKLPQSGKDSIRSGCSAASDCDLPRYNLIAGQIAVSAFAEEPIFRGVTLTLLRNLSPAVSAAISGGLTFLCYLRGRKHLSRAVGEAVKGIILAVAYLQTRSLFVVIVARCGTEILLVLGTRHLISPTLSMLRYQLTMSLSRNKALVHLLRLIKLRSR